VRLVFPGGGGGGGAASDIWHDAVQAGAGFFAGHRGNPAAGQYYHVQLLNPAASGKTLKVFHCHAGLNVAQRYQVREYDTALTTLVRNGVNCLSGSAAGVGELRAQSNAAQLGALACEVQTGADLTTDLGDTWPFTLTQGNGMLITSFAVDTGVAAGFWWIEV
jgi:hypothetical protein